MLKLYTEVIKKCLRNLKLSKVVQNLYFKKFDKIFKLQIELIKKLLDNLKPTK